MSQLDEQTVNTLCSIMNHTEREELLKAFRDAAQQLLSRLQTNSQRRNIDVLIQTCHSLKGASANIGASGLAEQALLLEQYLRNLGSPECVEHENLECKIALLSTEYQATLTLLEARLLT